MTYLKGCGAHGWHSRTMVVPELPDEIWDKIHRYRCEKELKNEEDLEFTKGQLGASRWYAEGEHRARLEGERWAKHWYDEHEKQKAMRRRLQQQVNRLQARLRAIESPP